VLRCGESDGGPAGGAGHGRVTHRGTSARGLPAEPRKAFNQVQENVIRSGQPGRSTYRLIKLHEQQPDLAESLIEKEVPISRAAIASVAKPASVLSPKAGSSKPADRPAPPAATKPVPPGPVEASRAPVQLELALEADQLCTRLELILQQLNADRSAAIATRVAGLCQKLSRLAKLPGRSP